VKERGEGGGGEEDGEEEGGGPGSSVFKRTKRLRGKRKRAEIYTSNSIHSFQCYCRRVEEK